MNSPSAFVSSSGLLSRFTTTTDGAFFAAIVIVCRTTMKFGASTCMRQSPVFISLASNSPFFFVVTKKPVLTSARRNSDSGAAIRRHHPRKPITAPEAVLHQNVIAPRGIGSIE